MTKASGKSRAMGWKFAASLAAIAFATLPVKQADALVARDDVGVAGSVDANNQFAGVGQMFNRVVNPNGTFGGTFLCTGQLINPRTVVLAQHCTGDRPDAAYDAGQGNHMGFGFDPLDTFTGFDNWRKTPGGAINNPFTGVFESNAAQRFYNVLQVQSVFDTTEFFPGGDIFIASFDTPVIGLPSYGMLFSPLLGPTHAAQVGYGTTGTGSEGDVGGIDFKRRSGENMIDGLFTQNDFIAAEFGVPGFGFGSAESAQLLYHVDFDRPDRDPNDCQRGEFFGTGNGNDIVCNTPPFGPVFTLDGSSGVLISDHINWYGGDALARESGTAGGDSGSALFADTIYSRPLITGVLSGGWVNGVASPQGGYGDVAYYNPLFLFRDWLVENNPYVYASARDGNGNWSDARRWVQNMDPNYFFIDSLGRVRNGLPTAAQPGYFADDPKWGTVFDTDVSNGFGDEGPDLFLCQLDASFPCPPSSGLGATLADGGVVMLDAAEDGGGGGAPVGSRSSGPTASRGAPTGPGSTRFVPNNDFGAYGAWTGSADGTAHFFDVTLNNKGTTRLDMNVEIDNLTISGSHSALNVLSPYHLNSLVAVDQFDGDVNVDGTVSTREYMLWDGYLTGNGTINAETLFNLDGFISAGALDRVGAMTINGDYVQASHADMVVNIRRQGGVLTNDFIEVNGGASLDGDVLVLPVNGASRPRFQDIYTVLHADTVLGNFDDVDLVLGGPVLFGESVVRAGGNVDIVVRARRIGDHFGQGHALHSISAALDELRFGGNFSNLAGVFDLVDGASFAGFEGALFSLTPSNAFATVPLAVQYSQGFIQGLDARGAELRAGMHGMSQTSLLAGQRIARAGLAGAEALSGEASPVDFGDRFGMFISGQGNLGTVGDEAYEGDRYNPASLSAFSQASMTVGADYRLNDHFAIGVATTMSHDLARDVQTGITPLDHKGYGAMAYASAWDGGWHLDTYAGVARHEYEIARVPGFTLGGAEEAAPGATQSMAGVRGGWSFEPIDGLSIGPSLAVSYSNLSLDAYREHGASDFALEIDGRTLSSLTVETALAFAYQPFSADGASNLSAYGRVGIVNEIGDGADLVSAHFVAAPEIAFGLSNELDRQWMSASAGFSYKLGENSSVHLEAITDQGRGVLSNSSVQAGFAWTF